MNELITHFHFIRPLWFWMVFPVLLISLLCWQKLQTSQGWRRVISPELLPFLLDGQSKQIKRRPLALLFLIWIIAIIALAGPSWEKQNLPVYARQDALIIVLDLSLSMYAADIKPSRIIRARHKILDILSKRDEGLTALIAYSGDSHIVSPLTDDNETIKNFMPALSPSIMPVPGSDPVRAIERALYLFESINMKRGRILLVSDSVTEDDVASIARLINQDSHQLLLLGVGTIEGAPIKTKNGELLRDSAQNIIISKLPNSLFENLARSTNGIYKKISWDPSDTNSLLTNNIINELDNTRETKSRVEQWRDNGYWLIFLLLPTSLLSFRRGWLLATIPLWLVPIEQTNAFSWADLWYSKDQQGAQAMKAGQSEKASELFENNKWLGAANYKSDKFEQAADAFSKGQSSIDHYNRGNTQAKLGNLKEAKKSYNIALELEPYMEDALFNKKLIEEIQKKQKEKNDLNDKNKKDTGKNNANKNQSKSPDDTNQKIEKNTESKRAELPAQKKINTNEKLKEKEKEKEKDQHANTKNQLSRDTNPLGKNKLIEQEERKEKKQATEQWLRRVPDDPAGLLRRKFKYESTQKNRTQNDNKIYW